MLNESSPYSDTTVPPSAPHPPRTSLRTTLFLLIPIIIALRTRVRKPLGFINPLIDLFNTALLTFPSQIPFLIRLSVRAGIEALHFLLVGRQHGHGFAEHV